MNRIVGDRLRRMRGRASNDEGISIVEVMAAALIFMLLFVGIAQGLVTVIRLAGDQKSRVTALSLAAGEIDRIRAYQSVFDVKDDERDITPDTGDGTVYTIHRTTAWVDSTGNDVSCNGGSGTDMVMLRVNITVTWHGQMNPIKPVQTDTLLAPNGSLNDPNRGVLILAVKGADGFGVKGVSVDLTPSGTIDGTVPVPSTTDDNGCSFAIGVPVGDYTISLSKDGTYVDLEGNPEPIMLAGENTAHTYKFTAGTTKSLTAFMAKGALYNVWWDTGEATLNADLNASAPTRSWIWPGTKTITLMPLSSTTTKTRSFTGNPLRVFPDSAGYSAVYGSYSEPNQAGAGGCLAPNPARWQAGSGLQAGVLDAVAGSSDAATSMRVGVGVVHVKLQAETKSQNTWASGSAPAQETGIKATMLGSGGNDNPGCVVTMSLSTSELAMGEFDLVLPYGAWSLSLTTTQSDTWNCGSGWSSKRCWYEFSADFSQVTQGSLSGTTVVLDPRRP